MILFDLDGTLVDSYRAIHASVNFVRERVGLPPIGLPEVHAAVGNGLHRLLEITVPGGSLTECERWYHEHHPTVLATHTDWLPEVLPIIKFLREMDYRLGICSNKPLRFTQDLISHFQVQELFAILLGPESVPNRKPAPDMLLYAASQLDIELQEMVYIGDMRIDIATGKAAGVETWVIPTGSDSLEDLIAAEPDRLLSHFGEIQDLLSVQ